jgi:hypothetical protein
MPCRQALCLVVLVLSQAIAQADVLHLRKGGRVEGEVLNADEYPRKHYIIQTPSGVRLTLAAEEVEHMVLLTPEEEEYERLRRATPDTADGHWKLVEWCTQRRMLVDRKHHLEKVIEHDPNHAQARQILGYQLIDGQWQTRADIMESRGYQYYEGTWRTPQDIALREARKAREEAELEWKSKLRHCHAALVGNDPARAAEAEQLLLSATDEHAAPALVDLIASERVPEIRKLLIDALAGNPSATASIALLELALADVDPEIRVRAADALLERKHPDLVRHLAKSLKSNVNEEVNRAATLLAALEYDSAISPLIDALVTRHRYKIGPDNPQVSAGFSPGRGGGLRYGGGGPKIVEQPVENHDVLAALVKLSGGENFEFNVFLWRRWYASTLRVEPVSMRRD